MCTICVVATPYLHYMIKRSGQGIYDEKYPGKGSIWWKDPGKGSMWCNDPSNGSYLIIRSEKDPIFLSMWVCEYVCYDKNEWLYWLKDWNGCDYFS